MKTGLIHIYFGDGKGKTTAAMGLSLRAAGYGYRVLIYQFMKDNDSSERNIMKEINNITLVEGLEKEKFSSQMTEKEKLQRFDYYNTQFKNITDKAVEEDYQVLFMDEIIYTITAGLLDENLVVSFLKNKPENLEVILTGNTPSQELLELADYVSEIRKIKHPFDAGTAARRGIEK